MTLALRSVFAFYALVYAGIALGKGSAMYGVGALAIILAGWACTRREAVK